MFLVKIAAYLFLATPQFSKASKDARLKAPEVTTMPISSKISKDPLSRHTAKSAIHCVQLCIRNAACYVAVFYEDQHVQNPCHLFTNLNEEDVDVRDEDSTSTTMAYTIQPPRSCKEVYERHGVRESGIYQLRNIGDHYCEMDLGYCGTGGWTLALKVDGNKQTFNYSSPYWTNTSTYNERECLSNLTSNEEGKFLAFNDLPFDSMCLDMKEQSTYRGIKLPIAGQSLYTLFKAGEYIQTSVGKDAWKYITKNSSLQLYCPREGLNIETYKLAARLGFIANNIEDCTNPDSVIGVGLLSVRPVCGTASFTFVSGNFARCEADNGDRDTVTVSRLFLQ